MNKKMALVIAALSLTTSWSAKAGTQVVNGITWTYTVAGNAAKVVGASPSTGAITIPSSLGGYYVTSIGEHAFSGCSGLTSITIPSSVRNIGDNAFYGCCGLANVAIKAGVKSIGNGVFSSCTGLTNIAIPASVTSIGSSAFYNCRKLTSVTIPNSVTNVGSYAFSGCNGLTSIEMPLNLSDIGRSVFSGCTGLANIMIPSSVTSIGGSAFYACRKLTNVTIPNSVTNIGYGAFMGCGGLTSIEIPSCVTDIGDGAFSDCSSLMSINVAEGNENFSSEDGILYDESETELICFPGGTKGACIIPSNVTSICNRAFYGCRKLTSITIPSSVTSIGECAFAFCDDLTCITIPSSVTHIGYDVCSGCTRLTDVTVPGWQCGLAFTSVENLTISEGTKEILSAAFWYCSGLKSVTIPNSVTNIGPSAFYGCKSITSVTIPASVISIGDSAFYGCSGLTDVTVPGWKCSLDFSSVKKLTISEGTKEIPSEAFPNCCELKSVTISKGVTNIGGRAFYNCQELTNLTIPSTVVGIGDYAFYGCSKLTDVCVPGWKCGIDFTSVNNLVISDGTASVLPSAFLGCSGLTSVSIPNSVTNIGSKAFYNCYGLLAVVVGNDNAFYASCDGVLYNKAKTELIFFPTGKNGAYVIPSGVTNVNELAFCNCYGLTSATIKDGVASIGSYAFSGCSGLTSITISPSLKNVGDNAFYGCNGLADVTVPGWKCGIDFSTVKSLRISDGTQDIPTYAFLGCGGVTNLIITSSVTNIGYGAFHSCNGLINVTIEDGLVSIGDYAFYDCCSMPNVVIPSSVRNIGRFSFYGCSGLVDVLIEDGLTSIGGYAFSNCRGLASITIPSSVTKICECAFSGCNGLGTGVVIVDGCVLTFNANVPSSLVLPKGTRLVADDVFANCYGRNVITSVTIPSSVTSIGNDAFCNCYRLTSLVIENGVTSIGDNAFCQCGIKNVIIPGSVTSVGSSAFSGCVALSDIVMENGVKSIGDKAFFRCGGLTDVNIPNSVTNIGDSAFNGCYSIINVALGRSVMRIGDSAFCDCSRLVSIIIPNSVISVGDNAFYGCSGLTSASINDGTTSIGGSAFYDCSKLTDLTIPGSVTNIGDNAFYGCSKLQFLDFEGAPPRALSGTAISSTVAIRYNKRYAVEWAMAIQECGFLNAAPYDPWPAPTMMPESGSVIDSTLTVSFSPLDGATIHYTIDGSEPTAESPIYSKKFRISKKTIVKAIAVYDNGKCSDVAVAEYAEGTCADPEISPADGATFTHSNQAVTIDWNEAEGVVRYTLDGSEPTEDSMVYNSSFTISETATVKAKVFSDEYFNSQVVTAKLTRKWLTVESPTISADADFVGAINQVSILCSTDDATIYYTTDGSTPTSSSKVYDGAFVVTNSCVVKAVALCDDMKDSGVSSIAITRNWLPIGDVTVQAKSQFVGASTPVTLSCATEGVAIYYTLDGSEPTAQSTAYEGSFDVTNSCTVRALAVLSNEVYRGTSETSFAITRNWLPVDAPTINAKAAFTGSKTPVEISCATEGATIYYTTDGSTPSAQSTVYESAFSVTNSCTIRAVSILSNDVYRGAVEVSFAIEKIWTIGDALNVPDMIFTTSGDAEWVRDTAATHDGTEAMRSGEIDNNQQMEISTTVDGVGVFSFWLKTSCEDSGGYYDWDHVEFYVDDSVLYFDGQHDWTNVVCRLKTEGVHTLRWVYMKDNEEEDGDDCVWLDDVSWVAYTDPIPDIGENPTKEQIAEALSGSADEKLAECITNAANYKAYREWAESVKGTNGTVTAGAQAVKDSPNAWVSFALGSDKLLEAPPTDEDLKVEKFEPASESGKFDFTVSVEGVEVGSEAQKENLKQVFGLEGAATLDPGAFASGNVDLIFGTPENGKVKFTAGPKNTQAETFFMKVKVK